MKTKIVYKNWFVLGLLLVGLHASVAFAQLSASDREAVQRYRAAIGAAESGASTSALETALSALARVREALLGVRGGQTVLESLSEPQFADLQQQLPGALVNREEVVVVAPDPDYFRRLAAAHGDAADKAFFDALKATYPGGAWPVYVERQTDYSGCTRFGSMSLVGTYRAWRDFQRRYPGRYAVAAQAEAKAVLDDLATSTCSCGNAAGVQAELQRFVQAFPASPARAEVEQRLKAARAGKSDIRMQCVSG
jgi:hypothetical protein